MSSQSHSFLGLPREAWGSPFGWGLAVVLAIAILAGTLALHYAGGMTSPTAFGRNPDNYGPIRLPIDVEAILAGGAYEMRSPGDAGEVYREAADAFTVSVGARRPYDEFLHPSRTAPAAEGELPLMEMLLEAAGYEQATIFADAPAELIGYTTRHRLEALHVLGQCLAKQASLLARGRDVASFEEARENFDAAFVVGVHLYRERIVHRQLEVGFLLIGQSLGGLSAMAQADRDTPRQQLLEEQRRGFAEYVNGHLEPVWRILSAINIVRRTDDTADRHVGDVAAIAHSGRADPMWRLEAILRLGKYRHDASRTADRVGAQRHLERMAGRVSDDRLRLAVERALALTEAERMVAR